MPFARTRSFKSKTLTAGLLARSLTKLHLTYAVDGDNPHISLGQHLPDGSIKHDYDLNFSGLEHICDLKSQLVHLELRFKTKDGGSVYCTISGGVSDIVIYVSSAMASDVAGIFETLLKNLALEELQKEVSTNDTKFVSEVDQISSRLQAIEDTLFGPRRRLRCFLSYRYRPATEGIAIRLQHFLTLLDVEVITGNAYEPRPISVKVLDRLSGPLDFVILLVDSEGESMWTRDEIASTKNRGIPLIPIVQADTKFEPGIFGDLEYIPYQEGHIGDSFLKILEAIAFIRSQIGTAATKKRLIEETKS
jgi:hypothetical protein